MKEIARQIFVRALEGSSVMKAFAKHVSSNRGVLRISEDLYDLGSYSRIFVISLGKAAHSMLSALTEAAGARFEGIVASPVEPEFYLPGFRYFLGGHPLPNAESIRAAQAMLKSLALLDRTALVVYLVSGGGSATAEKPLDEEISLTDLIATYRALVHSGAPIADINAIRKHLSSIKGGRLAQVAYPAQQVSIMVSDVPDSTPDALASGPTMPDRTTIEDCYRIAGTLRIERQVSSDPRSPKEADSNLIRGFPSSVRELFERHTLEETPKPGAGAFNRSRWSTILSNAALVEAARQEAELQGFTVEIDNTPDDWDYAKAADYLVERLHALRAKTKPVCLLSGGEVTVQVENGGTGGRNQQFALYCASRIAGQSACVLSGGSDGIDGNSSIAGAVVDGKTLELGEARGLDVAAHLAGFNAYPFFAALGDAVITGPTGNNLRDLRILLAN